jgi:hypothetical protein
MLTYIVACFFGDTRPWSNIRLIFHFSLTIALALLALHFCFWAFFLRVIAFLHGNHIARPYKLALFGYPVRHHAAKQQTAY